MASHLDKLEGVFNDAPSLDTAQVWHTAAIAAYMHDDITISELSMIGDAVRSWARVNGVPYL